MESAKFEAAPEARLISLTDVIRLTGRGRSRIYESARAGEFPAPIKDGASSRWLLSEVTNWIARRVAARDAAKSS